MGLGEEVIAVKEWSVAEYLGLFEPGSPDHALLVERSARLRSITVRTLKDGAGRVFEDTTFVEIGGQTWTVRARL